MSGILIGMCICCFCCILYIASSCYILFMSESCSDVKKYCDNEFIGDAERNANCKKSFISAENYIFDPAGLTDAQKKMFVNIDKYTSSIQKFKKQTGPTEKLSCVKKLVLSEYFFTLMQFIEFSQLEKNKAKLQDSNMIKIKKFYTEMSDADATIFVNDKTQFNGIFYNMAYAVKYMKNPNYNAPILPSKFDKTIFIDLFDAFGITNSTINV
jgi:hypothetical protein